MVGARVLTSCGLLAAGCLTAPPPPDEAACTPILRNQFDDGALWSAYVEPGAEVARAPDGVWISAVPSDQTQVYADVHSEAVLPLDGSDLAAALVVDGERAVGGISWTHDEAAGPDDDDYFDLVVDSGYLHPARKPAFGELVVLCAPDCPLYDPARHQLLRMRAAAGEVRYQVSADGDSWSDIASAPLVDLAYRSVAFAYAVSPGESNLSVSEMEWAQCGGSAEQAP